MASKTISLASVATYERAVGGKVYPQGTLFMPLSAISGPEEKIHYMAEAGEIESRYCAIMPKDTVDPYFFYLAMVETVDRFLAQYQTTINLQFDALRHYRLPPLPPMEYQRAVGEFMRVWDKLTGLYMQLLEALKQLKAWCLSVMFVGGD